MEIVAVIVVVIYVLFLSYWCASLTWNVDVEWLSAMHLSQGFLYLQVTLHLVFFKNVLLFLVIAEIFHQRKAHCSSFLSSTLLVCTLKEIGWSIGTWIKPLRDHPLLEFLEPLKGLLWCCKLEAAAQYQTAMYKVGDMSPLSCFFIIA